MRRFGPPPRPGPAYRPRPGVYAVVTDGRRLLLTEQDGVEREVQLPGGGIDHGEAPLAALHREVLEETGHRIRVLRRLGVFQRWTFMPEYGIHARKICRIYLARPGPRLGPPGEAGHRALWLEPRAAVAALGVEGDAFFAARATGVPPRRPRG